MPTLIRRCRTTRSTGDSGVAIVAAMAVVMLVAILLAVVVTIALSEATQTGRDRQRSSGAATAEGRLDSVVAELSSATPATLASYCGTQAGTADVAADSFGLETTVTYYAVNDVAVDCAMVPYVPVAQAKIVVHATSNQINGTAAAKRGVETLVRLTPNFDVYLDKALFSDGDLNIQSNVDINGSSPDKFDADIYANGSYTCPNGSNQVIQGSIHAQGAVNLADSCDVYGDAWAGTTLEITHKQATVTGAGKAAQRIEYNKNNYGASSLVAPVIVQNGGSPACNDASICKIDNPGMPPAVPFPVLTWDAAARAEWVTQGYTNTEVLSEAQCGTGLGDWLSANGSTLPADTIVEITCDPAQRPSIAKSSITLNHNVVLVSSAGLVVANKATIDASDVTAGTDRFFYVIQPFSMDGTPAPACSPSDPAIQVDNNFSNQVSTLLYSPCAIQRENNSKFFGQIYSGTEIQSKNQLNMGFSPLPVWGGLTNASADIVSYDVNALYRREVS